MNLKEIFDQLSYGELSQISIGKQDAGTINEHNHRQVVGHIQMALTALHKRFNIREAQLYLHLKPEVTRYRLDAASLTASKNILPPVQTYELDSVFTELGELLKIERVYTECGFEMALNDLGNDWALRTPDLRTITVPENLVNGYLDLPDYLKGSTLKVVFRANHPKLVPDEEWTFIEKTRFVPEEYLVQLPEPFMEAMLYYIASRVNNPMGMTNEFHAGNMYAQKYELACKELEIANLQIDQGSQMSKLRARGFV